MKYREPNIAEKSFTCPHCGVLARQYRWGYPNSQNANAVAKNHNAFIRSPLRVSKCENCGDFAIWRDTTMVSPDRGSAPPPNPAMPDDIKKDYEEAASILVRSPRGAAALLRLAIQKLCSHLGESGTNINNDIKALVAKGLPAKVQQCLDVVRVTGNNAVHPGQIDASDVNVAGSLFSLVNIIVEYTIEIPGRIDGLYDGLPDSAKDAIAKRDATDEST